MEAEDSPIAATLLVEIGAIGVEDGEPFTFASGMPSPMYCDNRLFLSRPAQRKALLEELYAAIEQSTGGDWDAVAGVASAGIPFAAWVAGRFDKPMVYIRPAQKDHGRQRQVEGGLSTGNVILVEDLVTTGGSALNAISALRNEGLECRLCFSIFDYEFRASATAFTSAGVQYRPLTRFREVLDVLRSSGRLSDADVDRVRRWHDRVDSEPVPA
jgi:orotate phosphoribosyltransferase